MMLLEHRAFGHLWRRGVNGRRSRITLGAAFLLAALFATVGAIPAHAGYAAIVVDANSGRVLHARNADTQNFPASLTKMMTLFLTFEALESGALTLDRPMRVSQRAAGQPPSSLGLREGETITVDTAIRAMSIKSANDVATVIAEAIGGTEVKFAQMMTERARSLGMNNTSFRNASGLPNRHQLSTARDMAILAQALIDRFPKYYGYFSESAFEFKGKRYRNHNALLRDYDGTDGIKTGYIRASGFNLVASAERDGIRLIGVVFGGKTADRRDRHMESLLDRSWANAQAKSTIAARPIPKPEISGRPQVVAAAIAAPVAPTLVPDASTNWGIQIGAFSGYTDAHMAAGTVARRLADLPLTATLTIQPVSQARDTLYRARLMGMDEAAARTSCQRLLNDGQPCMLVTPQGDELARLAN